MQEKLAKKGKPATTPGLFRRSVKPGTDQLQVWMNFKWQLKEILTTKQL